MRIAILVAVLASSLAACSPRPDPEKTNATVLTLHGEAEIKRVPDKATVWVGVEVRRPTGADAMRVQAEQSARVVAALKAAGVAEIDMQTTDLSLQPDINYGKGPRLRGYIATNNVQVTVRDLPKLGEMLDSVVKAGGVVERSLVFDVEAKGGALNEARQAAVKDAMAKAELYAEAMSYKIKRVVSVTEAGALPPPFPLYPQQIQLAEASVVMPGQITTGASVDVTFELEK